MKVFFNWAKYAVLPILAICLLNCSKNDDDASNNGNTEMPTNQDVLTSRQQILQGLEQTFTHTISEDDLLQPLEFTTQKGTLVSLTDLALNVNNQNTPLKKGDKVQLSIIELYDKGTMALTNRPTMGIYPESGDTNTTTIDNNGRLVATGKRAFIATGGQFHIDIRINNQPVSYYRFNLKVSAAHTGGLQSDMVVWQGNVNDNDQLTYTEFPISSELAWLYNSEIDDDEYNVYINSASQIVTQGSIGWINIDKYINSDAELTDMYIKVPDGYTNKNCATFIAFENQQGLADLNNYVKHDKHGQVFNYGYDALPIGQKVAVIFNSIDPKTKKSTYAIKKLTIQKDELITFKDTDLKTGTFKDVIDIINSL